MSRACSQTAPAIPEFATSIDPLDYVINVTSKKLYHMLPSNNPVTSTIARRIASYCFIISSCSVHKYLIMLNHKNEVLPQEYSKMALGSCNEKDH